MSIYHNLAAGNPVAAQSLSLPDYRQAGHGNQPAPKPEFARRSLRFRMMAIPLIGGKPIVSRCLFIICAVRNGLTAHYVRIGVELGFGTHSRRHECSLTGVLKQDNRSIE